MSLSLYSAIVPPSQQVLRSIDGLLDKAQAHCAENGIDPQEIIQARLAPDMYPFAYQVKSVVVHSVGALDGVRQGRFAPDMSPYPESFEGLKTRIGEALATLSAADEAEINALGGRPMRFEIARHFAEFTAEQFLLTFSVPNFYFHAATAYGLLRMKGLAIGKVDYLGRLNLQKAE